MIQVGEIMIMIMIDNMVRKLMDMGEGLNAAVAVVGHRIEARTGCENGQDAGRQEACSASPPCRKPTHDSLIRPFIAFPLYIRSLAVGPGHGTVHGFWAFKPYYRIA
jgi:hypothetical protein